MPANGFMQLTITRDDADRIVAIRVRMNGSGVRGAGRNVWRQIGGAPAYFIGVMHSLWSATPNPVDVARGAIPRARLRRDADGRAQAVVVNFGVEPGAAALEPERTIAELHPSTSVDRRLEARRHGFAIWNRLRSMAVLGYLLFMRDYRARSRQTFLGSVWTVGQQLLSYVPMVFVGGQLGWMGNGDASLYALHSVAGLLVWQVFWDGLNSPQWIGRRMRGLLSQAPVPAEAVLAAGCCQAAFNAVIYLAIMLATWVVLRRLPPLSIVLGIFSIPLVILAGLAIGVFVLPLTFIYLDFRYVLPFLAPAFVWSAPVMYDTPKSGPLYWVNRLNPLTYLVNAPRDWLTTGWRLENIVFPVTVVLSLALLAVGLRFYNRAMPRAIECLPRR
jgi:homopolymeric O-antigen transport system permease protein